MKRSAAVVLVCLSLSACVDTKMDVLETIDTGDPPRSGEVLYNASGLTGMDVLYVVDSGKMSPETKARVATGIYSQIVTATISFKNDPTWFWQPVEEMRVAVASPDLGLQFSGHSGPTLAGCSEFGQSGVFETYENQTNLAIELTPYAILCDESASQCPPGWICDREQVGFCRPPGAEAKSSIPCPDIEGDIAILDGASADKARVFALQTACLVSASRGSNCSLEQQLEAAVMALENNAERFLDKHHALAVVVISERDDCSVADKELFEAPGFEQSTSAACAFGGSHLQSLEQYKTRLAALKGGPGNVYFAAIAGVPPDLMESGCEGSGDRIGDCLKADSMKPRKANGRLVPACERYTPGSEGPVTSAEPARRLVQVAQDFGKNGFVFSVCHDNWFVALSGMAWVLAGRPYELDGCTGPLAWNAESRQIPCDLWAKIDVALDDKDECGKNCKCPKALSDPAQPHGAARVEIDRAAGLATLYCPVPQAQSPLDCDAAKEEFDDEGVMWRYCVNSQENTQEACSDDIDNDSDSAVDCEDDQCYRCPGCSENQGEPSFCPSRCMQSIRLSRGLKKYARSGFVLRCPA